eukprot:6753671-Prymnesium_polylepis.1
MGARHRRARAVAPRRPRRALRPRRRRARPSRLLSRAPAGLFQDEVGGAAAADAARLCDGLAQLGAPQSERPAAPPQERGVYTRLGA